MKPNSRWLVGYGGALAAVGAGLLVRLGLEALAGKGLPTYITFYPAVMTVALLGGVGPGLVATLATGLVVDYWLLPPRGQFGIESLVDAVGVAFFLGMGVFMSLVAEFYRRVRQRAAMYEKHIPPWESRAEPPQTLGQHLLLNGGIALSLAILVGTGWHVQRNMTAMVEADRLVTRTYVANEQIKHLLMALQDMDRSVRGYLITGQKEFLQPYLAALPECAKRLAALQAQSRETPALAQRLAGLEPLVADRLALWKETLELRQSKGFEAAQALVATGKGSALTEDIRRQMAGVQQEQDQLFRERTEAKDASLRRARQALLAGGVLGFLTLAAVFVFLRQENAARRQAQTELRRHRDHLQDIVTARTAELAQANETMRQDREDLDRAQAVGQIGSWRLDLSRNVLTWSDENHRIFGLPKGTPLTYEAFLGCVHPDDREYVDTRWKASLAGKPYDIEHRVVAGGQVKWVREKAYLDFDAAGKLVGGFGITQDITERKQVEEALRASEGQLRQHVAELQAANEEVRNSRRAAMNMMEDAVRARKHAEQASAEAQSAAEQRRLALEAADLGAWDYHFLTGEVFWDERCREMWGIPQAEKIEYDRAIAAIHPEDRAAVDESVKQSLAGKDGGAYHREFRVVWPDGSTHWIASHGRVYFQGEGDQHRPIRFTGANREVTAERQAAEAVRQSEERYRGLVELSPEAVFVNRHDRIVLVNPAALGLFGASSPEQLLGKSPFAVFHPDCHITMRERISKLLAGHRAPVLEEKIVRLDGVVVDVEVVAAPVTDQGERAILVLVRDITERKRAEAALRQTTEDLQRSNRDLEQFAYVASHDLQEPLRAVGGYVRLLEHRFPENLDAKARGYIAGAFEGAMRMERLITDLLAYSRVGTRGGNFAPAALDAILDQALRNLQVGIQSARAKITHDSLPALSVDAAQMMQLFQNLIGNAIKFHGESPPRIHVGAQAEEGRWVFSVRDNGIGIEPQYYERIFHIFQRLHTRKAYPGTGIGLAICKKIVERHGGTIWLESQPGQGSTFYFSIPENGSEMAASS